MRGLILVGDHNQLPPIGPGNILRDLVQTMATPAVILDTVWCQSRYSPCRMFCPRSIYSWWREVWLERVPEEVPVAVQNPSQGQRPIKLPTKPELVSASAASATLELARAPHREVKVG